MPALVETDHARADTVEHGFGEPAALVELGVGFEQFRLLFVDALGHAVKGAAEGRKFVRTGGFPHTHRKIARAHPLRRIDEIRDRPREPVRQR